MAGKTLLAGLILLALPWGSGCSNAEEELLAEIQALQQTIADQEAEIQALTATIADLEARKRELLYAVSDSQVRLRQLQAEYPEVGTDAEKPPAALRIEIQPETIVCQDDWHHWILVLTETNGVGVSLSRITRVLYNEKDHVSDQTTSTPDSAATWFPDHIQPNGSITLASGAPCSLGIRLQYIVEGTDDNGHHVIESKQVVLH
jgi:hypothetical protein